MKTLCCVLFAFGFITIGTADSCVAQVEESTIWTYFVTEECGRIQDVPCTMVTVSNNPAPPCTDNECVYVSLLLGTNCEADAYRFNPNETFETIEPYADGTESFKSESLFDLSYCVQRSYCPRTCDANGMCASEATNFFSDTTQWVMPDYEYEGDWTCAD